MCLFTTLPGEACWWTIHPASKQRSEGEKVRVGDDLILVSVATERYLVIKLVVINYLEKFKNFRMNVNSILLKKTTCLSSTPRFT